MKNKIRAIRIGLLLGILALFLYAIYYEGHSLHSFVNDEAEFRGGDEYVESVAEGQLIIHGDKLYNAESLVPAPAQSDDCPT